MELALEGWAVAGWEQVGKGLHPGCGGLLRLRLLYLFIFRWFLGGVATGAGRKGWEGGETGREGCGLRLKRLKRAGGDRAGRQAQGCAGPPAPRVGDPAKAGVAMQRKARVARASREREGRGGRGFCSTRGSAGSALRELSGPRC